MTANEASRKCEKCKKPYEPATDAEPTYMVPTKLDLLCPRWTRKHLAKIVELRCAKM